MLMAEELMYVGFVDEDGIFNGDAETDFSTIVSGGLLAELFLMGRLHLSEDSLAVVDSAPTGESFLDMTLDQLGSDINFEKDDPEWMAIVMGQMAFSGQIFDRLLAQGYLRAEEQRKFGIFSTTKYYLQDRAVLDDYRNRERQIMIAGQIPDARSATLLFMAGILGDAGRPKFSRKDRKLYDRRWEALFGDYWGWMTTDNPAPITGLDQATRKAIGAMIISLGTIQAAGYSVDYTSYD